MIKDFIMAVKGTAQQLFCKHVDTLKSSCPFTGRTYTTCTVCLQRLNVEVTE
jgi:hypothetical protein